MLVTPDLDLKNEDRSGCIGLCNISRLLTMDLTFIFIFISDFILFFFFSFIFLFLEQLRLGVISHAVTSVTT